MSGTMSAEAIGRLLSKELKAGQRMQAQLYELGMINEGLKARLEWAEKHPTKVSENHYLGRFYWPATAYCEAALPCT